MTRMSAIRRMMEEDSKLGLPIGGRKVAMAPEFCAFNMSVLINGRLLEVECADPIPPKWCVVIKDNRAVMVEVK